MAYDKLQFVGYSIDTSPKDEGGHKVYLGLDDPKMDIDARCILIRRAMETALAKLPTSSPPGDTLTVFMAPEFFFRGARGAYDLDHVQYAIEQLQALASEPRWQDWLIVFGTILGEWDQSDEPNADKYAVNFALIQEGGIAASGNSGARIVTKELKSDIDFISGVANPGGILWGGIEHMDPGPTGPGREAQFINYDGAGIFEACGITWAADICLDHRTGRLLNSPQLPGSNEIQVQLVPSGGARITMKGVIAQPGGLIFNVDGQDGSSATLKRFTPPLTTILPLPAIAVSNANIDLPDVSPPQSVPTDDLYRYGAGAIVIYGSIDTPASRKVDGTVVPLEWDTGTDLKLKFSIIYDAAGAYLTTLCQITSPEVPAMVQDYFLPLDLKTKDRLGEAFKIKAEIGGGASGYDHSCQCTIVSRDFDFSGVAFLFNDRSPDSSPPPEPPKTAF